MKQILTLLLAVGFFTAAQAQTSRDEARRVILGGGGSGSNGSSGRDVILGGGNSGESYPYPGNYPTSGSSQSRMDQVNRDYDNKIQSIRNNPYLSNEEKQRTIRQLEKDRQNRIRQLGNYDDRRYDNDRYDNNRKDNGKHKGWYKKEKNKNWKKGKS